MAKYLDENGLKHYTEKLKSSYFDFIDDVQKKPENETRSVANPVMTGTWKVYNANGVELTSMGGSSVGSLEYGYQASWNGSYKWTHSDTTLDPKTVTGSFGSTVPASGVSVQYPDNDKKTTTAKTISVQLKTTVSETKYTFSDGYINKTTNNVTKNSTTQSTSVSFFDYRYYGVCTSADPTASDILRLNSDKTAGKTLTVNNLNMTDDQHYVFAYPSKSLGTTANGDLTAITNVGTLTIGMLGEFNKKTINITCAPGNTKEYIVYTSRKTGISKNNGTLKFNQSN